MEREDAKWFTFLSFEFNCMNIKSISVYCASSSKVDEAYKQQAFLLGNLLAKAGVEVLFGSGSVGLMGELAKGVLQEKGKIVGVIPQFMIDEGWGNGLVQQIVTHSMHERKKLMADRADAAIALPGGCGTMEELLEIITWKQLGLFHGPIVIVNINHFYDDLLRMLDHAVSENFMRKEHRDIWIVVDKVDDALPAILNAPKWSDDPRSFAAI